jgi:hypothetical protein
MKTAFVCLVKPSCRQCFVYSVTFNSYSFENFGASAVRSFTSVIYMLFGQAKLSSVLCLLTYFRLVVFENFEARAVKSFTSAIYMPALVTTVNHFHLQPFITVVNIAAL